MAEGIASRVMRAYVRGTQKGRVGGRLLYLTQDGEVVDLGQYTRDDLLTLAWAHNVAYRMTRDRGERSRLASARDASGRLGREVSRLTARGRGRVDPLKVEH